MGTWGGTRPNSGRKSKAWHQANATAPKASSSRRRIESATETSASPKAPAEPKKPETISAAAMMRAVEMIQEHSRAQADRRPEFNPFVAAKPPPGVVPSDKRMAMDSAIAGWANSAWLDGAVFNSISAEGVQFLGYPFLSQLAQRPEYRVISETIADDCTRKWIDFDVTGDEKEIQDRLSKDPRGERERMNDPDARKQRVARSGKADKVKALKDDQERLEVRDRFYQTIVNDGFFGRSHLEIDLGVGREELKTPLGDGRSELSRAKVQKGSFRDLKVIEPVWTYPTTYNATNPLEPWWYDPEVWYVMGVEVHKSRLMPFVGSPVPDMLKPAYSFGGLSLSQMAMPYVDIWLQTRQHVADLIRNFSIVALSSNLATLLQPGGANDLIARCLLFNATRDNQGLMLLNKADEELTNITTPLGGLDHLQAQAQEHMCVQAGTLIETDQGQIPIEDVTNSHRVLTRCGFSPIKWVGVTDHRDTLIEIDAGCSRIRVTKEHPVWSSTTNDFVNAENVQVSHCLLALDAPGNMANRLLGEEDGGGRPIWDITGIKKREDSYIGRCGRRIAGQFHRAMKSITSTMMGATICGTISNYLLALSIWKGMEEPVPSCPRNTQKNVMPAALISRRRYLVLNIAQANANGDHTRSITDGFHIDPMKRNVSAVENHSAQNEKHSHASVLDHAYSVPVSRVSVIKVPRQPVYNIEVDGPPEFFANGILVHNSSVCRIPLVKLTGISPSGLNATSEFEVKVYDDTISARQQRLMRSKLTRVINFEQLSMWGEVDPEITFRFEPLRELDEKERGEKEAKDAERNQKYVDMGALAPGEIRKAIIDDPTLPYTDLDPDEVPDLAHEEEEGLQPEGGRSDPADNGGAEDTRLPFAQDGRLQNRKFSRNIPVRRNRRGAGEMANDAGFSESDHPRGQPGNAGQFGSGGGGTEGPKKAAKADIGRAWENPKLLSKVVRKSKIEKTGEKFDDSFDTFSDSVGSWKYNIDQVSKITKEDRDSLKEGEYFEADQEVEEEQQNAEIHVDDVRTHLVGLFDKTAALLGLQEVDFGEQEFDGLTIDQAVAIDAAITRLDLQGEAGLIENRTDQLDAEVEYEEEDSKLIGEATDKLREQISKINDGALEALAAIKKIMSGEKESGNG